jgi:hypothetical protein
MPQVSQSRQLFSKKQSILLPLALHSGLSASPTCPLPIEPIIPAKMIEAGGPIWLYSFNHAAGEVNPETGNEFPGPRASCQ